MAFIFSANYHKIIFHYSRKFKSRLNFPYRLMHELKIKKELVNIRDSIIFDFIEYDEPIKSACMHYFKNGGKYTRPSIVLRISHLVNYHIQRAQELKTSQMLIAKFSEMIHTASLVHDDIVDFSDKRRNFPSVNKLYGTRTSILAGNLIMSKATSLIAQLNDPMLISILTNTIIDLVSGEIMQISVPTMNLMNNYLEKTFKKTASLFAHTCKSVKLFPTLSIDQDHCFNFGKYIGMSFQIIDDCLDYIGTEDIGKPLMADLISGLVTAPIIFASETKYPQLYHIIERKFSIPGDVENAYDLTLKSDGIDRARKLAFDYSLLAIDSINLIAPTPYHQDLIDN
ncbi:hypothetical protein HZS_2458, partial [Henneguya salminicola]